MMTSSQLIFDLSEENHHLATILMPNAVSSYMDCNKLKESYYKLLLKVHGFHPQKDFIGIELTIAYNYCYMYVLTKWMSLSAVRSVDEAVTTTAMQQSNVPLTDKMCCVVHPAVDDVIAICVERINMLKKQIGPTYATLGSPNTTPSQQLLKETSSPWFPTEVKVIVICLINIHIIDLLRNTRLPLASELSAVLLSYDESVLDSIVQAAQVNYRFHMLPLLPTEALSQACSHVKEVLYVTAAVVFYCNGNWSEALQVLRRCSSVELSDFCSYLRGLLLWQQTDYSSSSRVLSDLCERRNVHPLICYAATRLLGDCFSAQGKHHAAIQMYKRCLLKDFSLVLPLYLVAEQYRCLGLTDAELESLQLLTKLLHNKQRAAPQVNALKCSLFGVTQLLSYISVQEELISESQAVYALAKRSADNERYELAAEKYCEVLTTWSDAVSEDRRCCIKAPLPAARIVYLEAISVHMKASLFQKVVTLCETFLTKLAWLENYSGDPSESDRNVQRSSSTSGKESALSKRCVIYEADHYGAHADEAVAAKIALFQAEALLQLGKLDEAIACIESTLKSIEFFVVDDQLIRPPPVKKTRMDSEVGEDDASERKQLQMLLSDGYSLKARIMLARDDSVNVLHWFRLSAALDTESLEKAYVLTETLIRLNRRREACTYWLSKRGIDTTALDCFQIDVVIKQRSSLGKCEGELSATGTIKELAERYTAMDVEALNLLRTTKHAV